MSSNASDGENRVSAQIAGSIDDSERTRDVERRLLCERIAELERELARERHRRDQVVERYERLLVEARSEESEGGGLRDWLF